MIPMLTLPINDRWNAAVGLGPKVWRMADADEARLWQHRVNWSSQ